METVVIAGNDVVKNFKRKFHQKLHCKQEQVKANIAIDTSSQYAGGEFSCDSEPDSKSNKSFEELRIICVDETSGTLKQ